MRWCRHLIIVGLLLVTGGCQLAWQGQTSAVQPISDGPRAGHVYLVRGWIGLFSFGIDDIAEMLTARGVRTNVYQDVQRASLARAMVRTYSDARTREPIVLIGHSYGADDVVAIARDLNGANVPVDLLITLDPVIPPGVPGNVKQAVNFYQSNGVLDTLPWLRGIPLKQEVPGQGQLANIDIRQDRRDLLEPGTNHFTIDKNAKVQQEVVQFVMTVCPTRQQWLALHQRDGVMSKR